MFYVILHKNGIVNIEIQHKVIQYTFPRYFSFMTNFVLIKTTTTTTIATIAIEETQDIL